MKKTMTGTLVIALAVPAGAALAQTGSSEYKNVDAQLIRKYGDASRLYDKARTAYGTVKVVDGVAVKDIPTARKNLEACLKLIPDYADAHLLMAKIYYGEKNWDSALAEIAAAKSGFGATTGLYERMQKDRTVELKKRLREKDETLSDLRAQLSRAPVDQQRLIQERIDRADKERTDIDRLLDDSVVIADIPAEYHFVHGNVLLRMQRMNEAAEQYEEALRVRANYGEAANNLASVYYSTKQYDKAAEIVARAESRGLPFSPELKKAIESAKGTVR